MFKKNMLLKKLDNLKTQGLCSYHLDKDACGVGVVANIKGTKSNTIVKNSLEVLVNLEHRGACGCDPETGLLFPEWEMLFKSFNIKYDELVTDNDLTIFKLCLFLTFK